MRRILVVLLLTLTAAGCAAQVDVEKALQVVDIRTGWFDAGIQPDGQNKLVPSISLKLKNVSSAPISSVQVMAVFRRVNEAEVLDTHYIRAIGTEPLAPGASTKDIVLRATFGFTSPYPRLQILRHPGFIDANVKVFGKHGSRTFVQMQESKIDRTLLTR